MSVVEDVEAPELSTGKHPDPKLTVVPDSPTTANQESGYSSEHPWYTGGGALEDIAGIAGAVESKSWLDGGLSGLSLVADTASMFFDPLGTALSWGVAMIMDHCDPLRSWLHKLAGNQDDVSAKANTWRNVACALEENAKRMDANVASFTQYSRGQAANSFAESAGGVNALIVGAAQGARVLSQGLEILAGVVEVVYSMVRDAISQIVGTFISAVVQALLTAGLALAKLIPEISVKVSAWVSKLWGHIDSLLSSAGKLVTLFKSGGDLIASMVKKIKSGLKAGFGKGHAPAPHEPRHSAKHPKRRQPQSRIKEDPNSVRSRQDLLDDVTDEVEDPGLVAAIVNEGKISDLKGIDVVENPDNVCGFGKDGKPRTYAEWLDEHKTKYVDENGRIKVGHDWPPNDGYAGERKLSSFAEYSSEHGVIVDRVGGPNGKFLAAVEDGRVASFEERGLAPGSVHEPYYQYVFTGHMPEGWQIEHGIAASWESECGGVRQLRVLDQTRRPMKISELIQAGVLKGVEVPVGF
ncbi:TNT domain-containing protein [uncultured Actinomyces sp.]|uniref:TNT domain-containing protein n=1 Tax=uncultured Actinomyces sp. TaxID=249061 RepID=UPI0028E2EFBB|nr:TNT domain-containing protein [uncultured Actinomyces sp.]